MGTASKGMVVGDVDMAKVDALRAYSELIKVLDRWILIPDRNLIPALQELAAVVTSLYDYPKEITLFRGFNYGSKQDNMGVAEFPHAGQVVDYRHDNRALSFSTDIGIARLYGGVIVSAKFLTAKTAFLDITKELVYLVHEERGSEEYQTQDEVIILPPVSVRGTVVQSQRHPSGWLGW